MEEAQQELPIPFSTSSPTPPQQEGEQQPEQPQPQPEYYYSPSTSSTTTPDPILVTRVPKQNFTCFFLRYSTTLPPELSPYIQPAEYAASIKRLNAALTCRSWVWTFLVLALSFFLCGLVMIGIGSQRADNSKNNSSDDGGDEGSSEPAVGPPGPGGPNGTAPAGLIPPTDDDSSNQIFLKIGIAFAVFAFCCLGFTFRQWRLGRAKELTNALLIENSRYAQRRPVVRFRLMAGGWLAKLRQKSAPMRRWILQVEVCGGDTTDDWPGGGQQSFAVVNLPHSNVVRLRERMQFPLRTQPYGPAIVDVKAAAPQPIVPLLVPTTSSSSVRLDDGMDDDGEEEVSEHSLQPPPAYSDIEMQPIQHQQQPILPPLKPSAAAATESVDNTATLPTAPSSTAQSVDWQPVEKTAARDGAVVMLSSQAAVVDDGKVREYEEQLRRLVVERAQQDEKMQEMARELEKMRAAQQQSQPLVITLTEVSGGGVLRSLPPASPSERQSQQADGRLAVHTQSQQVEGLTPGSSNAAPTGGSRSGVVMLAGRRFSF